MHMTSSTSSSETRRHPLFDVRSWLVPLGSDIVLNLQKQLQTLRLYTNSNPTGVVYAETEQAVHKFLELHDPNHALTTPELVFRAIETIATAETKGITASTIVATATNAPTNRFCACAIIPYDEVHTAFPDDMLQPFNRYSNPKHTKRSDKTSQYFVYNPSVAEELSELEV